MTDKYAENGSERVGKVEVDEDASRDESGGETEALSSLITDETETTMTLIRDRDRHMKRLMANRRSARESYFRRKESTSLLQSESEALSKKNTDLMTENKCLREQVQDLRQQVAFLLRPRQSVTAPASTSLLRCLAFPSTIPGVSHLTTIQLQQLALMEQATRNNARRVASYDPGASVFVSPYRNFSNTSQHPMPSAAVRPVRPQVDLEALMRLHSQHDDRKSA